MGAAGIKNFVAVSCPYVTPGDKLVDPAASAASCMLALGHMTVHNNTSKLTYPYPPLLLSWYRSSPTHLMHTGYPGGCNC
jgi:hypothetical protein